MKLSRFLLTMGGRSVSTLFNASALYWKLDEASDGSGTVTRADSSPNGLNLTDNNTTASAAGLISNGADFEKTNTEYLSLAHSATIAGGPGVSWTMAAWYKPESLTVNDTVVAKNGRWGMQVSTGPQPGLYMYGSGGDITLTPSGATPELFVVGNWHLLIWGYNAATGRAFVRLNNGIKYEKAVTPVADGSGTLYLGQWLGTYADGIVDEVGRWPWALSDNEMAELYNSGNGTTWPFVGPRPAVATYTGPTSGATRLTNLQTAIDAGYSKIGCFGDSWMEGGGIGEANAPLVNGIRTAAQTEYGDAGIGFLKFQRVITDPDSRVTLYSASGWTDNATFSGHGPDLVEITAAGAATISYTATFDRMEVHYRQYATGGVFRFRVDAGSWQSVDTAGAEAYGKSELAGLSAAAHAVEIERVSGTVVLFGAEMTTGSTGCLVYRIGTSGMQSTHPSNNANWSAALTALDLDCLIILLGTNDITNDVSPAQYAANILATVAKVPLTCDVIVMPSPDEGRDIRSGKLYNMMQYNQAAYQALYGLGRVAWFSCVDDFGSYGLNQPRLYWGTLHLSTAGYTYLSGLIYAAMFAGR